jgi:hypothetical protein
MWTCWRRRLTAVVLVALAAWVTLTAAAAAGPDAAKQRVTVNTKILPRGTFVLTPVQSGALKPDSGTVRGNWASIPERRVTRDGQTVSIYNGALWTLTGKRGSLTIREHSEWVDVGSDVNGDAFPDGVGVGTWKFMRGTGQYAKLAGGGRSGHMGLGRTWVARYEGFLTVP